VDKLKTEYGVLNASLNGPKIWQPDWVTVNAGVERDFNGIPATWVAQLKMGDNLEGVAAKSRQTALPQSCPTSSLTSMTRPGRA